MSDWPDEEADEADRRNFYKVEKWSSDWLRVGTMFESRIRRRPRIRLTIRQRTRVLGHGRGGSV
jgi:hypothetical protein